MEFTISQQKIANKKAPNTEGFLWLIVRFLVLINRSNLA